MKKTLQFIMMCLFAVFTLSGCKKEKPILVEKTGEVRVSTLIGNINTGQAGYINGALARAEVKGPTDLVIDAVGNMYIADAGNYCVRKITTDGMVSTLAGSLFREAGLTDGAGTAARFRYPVALALDASGNIYVADAENHSIRKITQAGAVTTVAGNGTSGYVDGTGINAQFNNPTGIAVDATGNIYVSDTNNNRIRKITTAGVVTTLAGDGTRGAADGTGTAASFNRQRGIRIGSSGNIYVAEPNNNMIREVTPSGVVSTYVPVGSGSTNFSDGIIGVATFKGPTGLAFDAEGALYVTDSGTSLIRKIKNGKISTVVGLTGTAYTQSGGFVDGTAYFAQFKNPQGIVVDAYGTIYIADSGNNAVRKISFE